MGGLLTERFFCQQKGGRPTEEELIGFASAPDAVYGASHVVISPNHALWHRVLSQVRHFFLFKAECPEKSCAAVTELRWLELAKLTAVWLSLDIQLLLTH